jgi:TonB family protein
MRRPARYWLIVVSLLGCTSHAADESRVTHLEDESHERIPLNTVTPVYPPAARRDRIEGDVQVCFNVDREGSPYRIAVRTSTHRVFEKPAIRAIRASRYQPLEEDRAVPAIKTCRTFRFRLEPASAN